LGTPSARNGAAAATLRRSPANSRPKQPDNLALAVKELGGTGRAHDWSVSARIREVVKVPVFLAGGLRMDNVAEAVRSASPFGLDLCSGVRADGRLDPEKLARFFSRLRGSGAAPALTRG
jgi:phosphoribosylanthranilate isomerase